MGTYMASSMASSSSFSVMLLILSVVFSLSLNYYASVEATSRSRTISSTSVEEDDDLELERQLKILNKPPIKTIQTEEGDTFDCVDIYKQPAFDHPLLKNHKIQMAPSSIPKENSLKHDSTSSTQYQMATLQAVPCPDGTVPIRRTTKEELIRAKSFRVSNIPSSQNSSAKNIVIVPAGPGEHIAVRRSKEDPLPFFFGIKGDINVANPKVSKPNESTMAQIWIESNTEEDGNMTSLQAGWIVSPTLFNDHKTRFFIAWKNNIGNGCYNLLCPGFIQVNSQYPLGSVVTPSSEIGGIQFIFRLSIYEDDANNWWLQGGAGNQKFGYWPQELTNQIRFYAYRIAWGGRVVGYPHGEGPEMGNGHFPNNDLLATATVLNQQFIDTARQWYPAFDFRFETYSDGSPNCYKCEAVNDKHQGYTVLYGGPGGNVC